MEVLQYICYSALSKLIFLAQPLFFVILYAPLYVYREIVKFIAGVVRSDLGTALDSLNFAFALDDIYGRPKLNLVLSMYIKEGHGPISTEKIRKHLIENLVKIEDENGQLMYPELSQYPIRFGGLMFWKTVDAFDPSDYVVEDKFWSNLSPAKIDEYKHLLVTAPFEKEKCLYHIHLVRARNMDSRIIIFVKFHHCLGDGTTLMKIMGKLANASNQQDLYGSEKAFSENNLSRWYRAKLLKGIYSQVTTYFQPGDNNFWHLNSNELSSAFRCTEVSFPVSLVKEIKNYFKVNFTSVICSAIASAAGNTMMQQNLKVPSFMKMALTLPLPGRPDKLMNYSGLGILPVPVGAIKHPVKRLKMIDQEVSKIKSSNVSIGSFFFAQIAGIFPSVFTKLLITNNITTLGLSNFVGPSKKIVLKDHYDATIEKLSAWAGYGPGTMAVGNLAFSYSEIYTITSIFDASISKNEAFLHNFNSYIVKELESLKEHCETTF